MTFTDNHGNTRYKTEHLVTIAGPEANASETQSDDTAVADITSVITPGTVADVTTYAPAGAVATFSDNGGADGSRTAGTYTVTNAAGNASGTGADFTVVVAANGDPTVTLDSGGTGYADNETITIADASLGGGGGAAVVVTVTAAATAAATFTLSGASSTGAGASLTYQWQKQEAATGNWSTYLVRLQQILDHLQVLQSLLTMVTSTDVESTTPLVVLRRSVLLVH